MTADQHEHAAAAGLQFADQRSGECTSSVVALVSAINANTHAQLAVSQRIAELKDDLRCG